MSRIEEKSVLRAKMGNVGELAAKKTLVRLDKYARTFIEHSPFLCICTADENGNADVSPRGDPAGFVHIVDDRTVIIPDRPGNNRVDTMQNIVANPQVGILFLIPGMGHCSGGAGTDTFDGMGALEQWVEHGKAPNSIPASKVANGQVVRTRPLCPYPQVARYSGQGSTDEAANFSCVAPTTGTR